MDKIATSIKNRLSLRPPQAESLDILANLTDKLSLTKAPLLDKEGNKGWWCKTNYSKTPPRPPASPPETGGELKNYHASLRCVRISE